MVKRYLYTVLFAFFCLSIFFSFFFSRPVFADDNPIGKIVPSSIPLLMTPAVNDDGKLVGVVILLNNLLKIIFIAGGLFGFLNLIFAGLGFMGAGGDPKAITKSWDRIWQSFLGLLVMVTSFLFAAIIGILLFRDATAILQPKL